MNRILIVDDQEQNLYLSKSLLEGNGYQVVEAMKTLVNATAGN